MKCRLGLFILFIFVRTGIPGIQFQADQEQSAARPRLEMVSGYLYENKINIRTSPGFELCIPRLPQPFEPEPQSQTWTWQDVPAS